MTVIELPRGYRADLTLRHLGRDSDSLCESVEGNIIKTADLTVVLNAGEDSAHPSGTLRAEVTGPVATARKLLGLNLDPCSFETAQPALATGHEGAHLPQTPTVWESLMWAIVGQQVNLSFAYRLRRTLVELCGEVAPNGLRRHPPAEAVSRLELSDLTARQFSRSKAQYILDAARLVASGALPLEDCPSRAPAEVEAMLLAVRGVGAWTANYVMMRGCAFPDCVPAGDSALSASLQSHLALDHRPDASETRALMERFAPWRSLATYHFWLRRTA